MRQLMRASRVWLLAALGIGLGGMLLSYAPAAPATTSITETRSVSSEPLEAVSRVRPADTTSEPAGSGVQLDPDSLRIGDLIFRKGRSRDSRLVMRLDGRSPYSHVGIVDVTGGEVSVIHIVPGDPSEGADLVRRESLTEFLDSLAASAVAVYRVRNAADSVAAHAAEAARAYLRAEIPFDHDFDASSADRLYCTELVWRAYAAAGLDLVDGKLERLSIPFPAHRYVLLRTLQESDNLELVRSSHESLPPG